MQRSSPRLLQQCQEPPAHAFEPPLWECAPLTMGAPGPLLSAGKARSHLFPKPVSSPPAYYFSPQLLKEAQKCWTLLQAGATSRCPRRHRGFSQSGTMCLSAVSQAPLYWVEKVESSTFLLWVPLSQELLLAHGLVSPHHPSALVVSSTERRLKCHGEDALAFPRLLEMD